MTPCELFFTTQESRKRRDQLGYSQLGDPELGYSRLCCDAAESAVAVSIQFTASRLSIFSKPFETHFSSVKSSSGKNSIFSLDLITFKPKTAILLNI